MFLLFKFPELKEPDGLPVDSSENKNGEAESFQQPLQTSLILTNFSLEDAVDV